MQRYIAIRLIQAVFVLWAVNIIVFGLARAAGNPVLLMVPANARQEDFDRLNKYWGLDKPLHVQYWTYLSKGVQGDFGESLKWQGRSAMDMVKSRIVATLQLAGTSLIVTGIIGVVLGVLAAVKRDTPFDIAAKIFALFGQSAPAFWIGIMLVWIFAVELDWFPTSGRGGFKHMVLPVITLGWFEVAAIMRLVRSSMLDTQDSEYVKLARVKGLPEWKVAWKHSLRNAAIAPLTYFGILAGALVLGSVVVESVFAWPGLGLLTVQAVLFRDFQVIQAVAMVFAVGFISLNLIVDILYGYLDPRIRYG